MPAFGALGLYVMLSKVFLVLVLVIYFTRPHHASRLHLQFKAAPSGLIELHLRLRPCSVSPTTLQVTAAKGFRSIPHIRSNNKHQQGPAFKLPSPYQPPPMPLPCTKAAQSPAKARKRLITPNPRAVGVRVVWNAMQNERLVTPHNFRCGTLKTGTSY